MICDEIRLIRIGADSDLRVWPQTTPFFLEKAVGSRVDFVCITRAHFRLGENTILGIVAKVDRVTSESSKTLLRQITQLCNYVKRKDDPSRVSLRLAFGRTRASAREGNKHANKKLFEQICNVRFHCSGIGRITTFVFVQCWCIGDAARHRLHHECDIQLGSCVRQHG
jgi:hypothetical protein